MTTLLRLKCVRSCDEFSGVAVVRVMNAIHEPTPPRGGIPHDQAVLACRSRRRDSQPLSERENGNLTLRGGQSPRRDARRLASVR